MNGHNTFHTSQVIQICYSDSCLLGAFCPCDLKERTQNEYWTCNPENIITGKCPCMRQNKVNKTLHSVSRIIQKYFPL